MRWPRRDRPRDLRALVKPGRGREAEIAALLSSFRTDRDRAIARLMLLSRLQRRGARIAVADVDVGRSWVRVTGKGDKERRSRSTPTWADPTRSISSHCSFAPPAAGQAVLNS